MDLVVIYPDEMVATVKLSSLAVPTVGMDVRTGHGNFWIREVFLSINSDGTARYNAVLEAATDG